MNTHLEEYLEYYKKLSAPGYAVLVTGGSEKPIRFEIASQKMSIITSVYSA